MKSRSFLPILAAMAFAMLTGAAMADATLPSSLLAEKPPEKAVSVAKARDNKNLKAGDPIVLRGLVGGRVVSLAPKGAIAVLVDEKKVVPCSANPNDPCTTPWDYCCEDPDKLKASIATVQVRGADGKIVRATLRGLGKLKELSTIVVSGTVDDVSSKNMLVINAASIYVEKE